MPETDIETRDPFQLLGVTIEGKYRIASVIGDGGFGVVYRGVHLGFGEVIAVKCLKLPHALGDKQRESFLEQLRDEGRLLHRLSKATPGIVQALDVGAVTTPSGLWVPYLVLEWLDGETLADHVQRRLDRGDGPFPLVDALRLLEPAARALAVAHELKVAHRDVKPHNLFVAKVGAAWTLKVLDFGIAKVLTEYTTLTEALNSTQQAPTAFTPRYGAPEQFNKQRGATGPWTDVFALALITVELLAGKKALEGDDPTQLYVVAADPTLRPTPRALGVDVPEAVERVLAKALAVEPKNRFPEAGAMWDALLDAAGLSPNAALFMPSPRVSSSGPAGSPSVEKTALDRGGVPPTRVSTEKAGPSDIDATRPIEALGDARPSAVVIKVDRDATAASPGVGDKPAPRPVDPMSETPFFERHHLPPSKHLSVPKTSAPSGGADASTGAEAAPKSSRASWMFGLLVLLGGGAAAFHYASSFEPTLTPTPVHSASAPKKRPLPPRRDAGAAATPSHTAPVASATAAPARDAGHDGGEPQGPTEPFTAPTDMVLIAPATFKMGESEKLVTLAKGFYLDRTEVTVGAYERCVAKRMCGAADHVTLPPGAPERWSPRFDTTDGDAETPQAAYIETWSRRCNAPRGAGDHPINCVDYASAEAYCRFVGKRLPTEAEWELAARGEASRAYPWGDEKPECGRACYDKNGGCRGGGQDVATCAAGVHPADRTPEGIYDFGGNVSEWTRDADKPSNKRIVRGASFIDEEEKLKAFSREPTPPGLSHVAIGFRCAMDAPAGKP